MPLKESHDYRLHARLDRIAGTRLWRDEYDPSDHNVDNRIRERGS